MKNSLHHHNLCNFYFPVFQAAVFFSFTTNTRELQWSNAQSDTQPNTAVQVGVGSWSGNSH